MLYFLYNVISRLWSKRISDDSEELLDDKWMLIMSDDEIRFGQFNNKNKNKVVDELESLRKRDSSSSRIAILGKLNETFMQYNLGDVESVKLPSDLRGKIYKDVFYQLSEDWLTDVQEIYSEIPQLRENWTPTLYEKNILGQMVDMADCSSPETLSVNGLVHTIKNVHLCLSQELSALNVQSDTKQSKELLHSIMKMIIPVVELWCKTVKNSRGSISRQGKLPHKWAKEEQAHQEYLKELKNNGQIDQKYKDGTLDPIRQSYLKKETSNNGSLLDNTVMYQRQQQLEKKLERIHIKSSSWDANECPYTHKDFKQTQSKLASRLHFRNKK